MFVPGPPDGIALEKLTSIITAHLDDGGVVGLRGQGHSSLARSWEALGLATANRNVVVVDENGRSRGVETIQRREARSSRRSSQRLAWRLVVKATKGSAVLDIEGGTVDATEGNFPNGRTLLHQDDQRLVYLVGPFALASTAT